MRRVEAALCYKDDMLKTLIVAGLLIGAVAAVVAASADGFQATEKTWRDRRLARLTAETGWLTLVGLDWLEPGDNAFGSDAANPVRLPEGKAPAKAGVFVLEGGRVRVVPAPGTGMTIDGKPASARTLADDSTGKPDVLKIGDLIFYVVRRGDRFGVRIKDPNSPVRTKFKGLDYFPASPKWKIAGTFVPFAAPKKVEIPTVLGTTDTMESPGLVRFTVDGKELSLEPVVEDPEDPALWFIFSDRTSGKETYGAGRFLYAAMPKDGKVVLDFNQAYNPPCAFTPYATCPLPPKENRLPVRVEAGEKAYAGGHH